MKKILLVCSVAFMLSCSNDAETNNTQENLNGENVSSIASRPLPPVEDDIDQMFYEYVTSDIYLQKQEKLSNFNSLLGSGKTLSFESKAHLFSWIEANIHLTEFENIENAQNAWIEVENLVQQEIENFTNVYDFIEDASNVEVLHYTGKWFSTKYSTYATCYEQYTSCTKVANEQYKQTADDIKQGAGSDKKEHYSCAQRELKTAIDACDTALDKCHKSQQS